MKKLGFLYILALVKVLIVLAILSLGISCGKSVVLLQEEQEQEQVNVDDNTDHSTIPPFTLSQYSTHSPVFGESIILSYELDSSLEGVFSEDNLVFNIVNGTDWGASLVHLSANTFELTVPENTENARNTTLSIYYPGYRMVYFYVEQDGLPTISLDTYSVEAEPDTDFVNVYYSINSHVYAGTLDVELPEDAQEWMSFQKIPSSDSTGMIIFRLEENMQLERTADIKFSYSATDRLGTTDRTTYADDVNLVLTQKMVNIEVGDYFCVERKSDGSAGDWHIYKRSHGTTITSRSEVVGIVFSTDVSRIGNGEKAALLKAGVSEPHGLVIAVKNAGTYLQQMNPDDSWTVTKFVNSDQVTTVAEAFEEIEGYSNTWAVWDHSYYTNQTSLFPAYRAIENCNKGTNANVPTVPLSSTTGWYMPAIGQLLDFMKNFAGVDLSSYESSNASNWEMVNYGIDFKNAMNNWMFYLYSADKDDFVGDNYIEDAFNGYCSSSEDGSGQLYHPCLGFLDQYSAMITIQGDPQLYYNVRPVLAF